MQTQQHRLLDDRQGYALLAFLLVLAGAYYLSARWSLLLAFEGTNASPIWPPSGLAFSAILLLGRRSWPAILLGAFAANMETFISNHVTGPTWEVSAAIALGNTLEALAGYHLLRAMKILDAPFSNPLNIFKFMMTALLMCLVSAGIGTASLIAGGIAPYGARWPIWINWWLGDVGGVLSIAPLLLSRGRWRIPQRPFRIKRFLATLLLSSGFLGLTLLVFGGLVPAHHGDRLLLFLILPFLALFAYRHGQRGVSAATLLLAGIAVWKTTHGSGPFAIGNLNNSLILLVSFIILCCVTGLVLAADIRQRAQSKGGHVPFDDIRTPWLTFLAALALTIFTWHQISVQTERDAEKHFEDLSQEIMDDITERMAYYTQVMRSGAAMFSASEDFTRYDWFLFVQKLELKKLLPGHQALSFAEWVPDSEKASHIRRIRAEGYTDYDILPAGARDFYVPITYIEPMDARNRHALGFDMYSESTRRAAMDHARDTGHITLSGRVLLAQEAGNKNAPAGFVMYAPLYKPGGFLTTVSQRQAALVGFIGNGFRITDILAGTAGESSKQIGLEIYEGKRADPQSLIYANAARQQYSVGQNRDIFLIERTLDIADHDWHVRLTSLPSFEGAIDRQKAQILLISGIVVSLLLFVLVRSLAMTRENALHLAGEMTSALRESEAQLRLLNSRLDLAAEAGGIGIWTWDIPSGQLNWDKRMCAIYQLSPDAASVTYQAWRNRILAEDLPPVERAISEAIAGGRPFSEEFRIVLDNGDLRTIKAHALTTRDGQGEAQYMVGVNFDITELRRAEESLKASEERFRNIFEHAPIGMALVSLEGYWLDVNQAVSDIVGYSQNELEQITFKDITHPDDLETDLGHVQQLLDGSIQDYQIEKRYIRKDGSNTWVRLAVSLMRNETGTPQYFIAQIEDINQLKLSEQQLQETLALKTAILSSANQSIIATDPAGTIVSFNTGAERMLGYTEEEVVGRHTPAIIHVNAEIVQRAAALSQELQRAIAPGFETFVAKARAGHAEEREWTYVRKDGTRFPVSLSVTAIRGRQGKITGFLGIATDITDRKQKENMIAAALAEKEVLLKEVYHRVKNNLQVITSLFNLQLRSLPPGEARAALQDSADRVRAMALVHEKLYQSQDLSSISLGSYVQELCRQLDTVTASGQRGVVLTSEADNIEIGLELAVPLGLLLNELISNSLKHGYPEGRTGTVRVSIRGNPEDAGAVDLQVSDDGVGLAPGLDIHASTSLGLRLVESLSAQIDGRFSIESNGGTVAKLHFRIDQKNQPDRMNTSSPRERK